MNNIIEQLERPDLDRSYSCLDLENGEMIVIASDVMQAVMDSDIEQISSFPEWKKDLVETAEDIIFYEKERFAAVPKELLTLTKHLMAEFINAIENRTLKDELQASLDSNSPLETFELVLDEYPEDKEAWATFCGDEMEAAVSAWLSSLA